VSFVCAPLCWQDVPAVGPSRVIITYSIFSSRIRIQWILVKHAFKTGRSGSAKLPDPNHGWFFSNIALFVAERENKICFTNALARLQVTVI
jgi:hypothetical protein